MSSDSVIDNPLLRLSHLLADTVERAGRSVVAVNSGGFPSSGIHWREGVIVTSDETLKPEAELTVTLPEGRTVGVT
ncbi:MAG: LuxR family transcriptional regulator, partial [Microcystaceae cyanobacterium]